MNVWTFVSGLGIGMFLSGVLMLALASTSKKG